MIPGVGPVPTPLTRYDRINETEFRRHIQRVLEMLSRQVRFEGDPVEGATLQIVDGVPTWVAPSP